MTSFYLLILFIRSYTDTQFPSEPLPCSCVVLTSLKLVHSSIQEQFTLSCSCVDLTTSVLSVRTSWQLVLYSG